MDEIISIIERTCLKHHDSGESSCAREARLIIKALEDEGYIISKPEEPAELPNSYLDIGDKITYEEKEKIINNVTELAAKSLLLTFLTCKLKSHIDRMIKEQISGDEYILSFKKLTKQHKIDTFE